MKSKMKMVTLVGVLLAAVMTASSVNAFEKGANRVRNSDFENDNVGEPPREWAIEKGG